MIKKQISLFLFTVIFLLVCVPTQTFAVDVTGVDVNLIVHGCNNNGICEPGLGENNINCALDCTTPTPPTVTLTANPTGVNPGNSSTLTWSSTNSTACSASWTSSTATTGSESVSPAVTTTYSITCTGPGGSTSDSATVTVVAPTAPTVTLTANPTSVNSGNFSTLTWSSTNSTSCSATSPALWTSSTATAGSESVSPAVTTTYSITCTGAGGTADGSATVTVVALTPPPPRGGTGGGLTYGSNLVITNLSVSADQQSAVISWSGNNTALSVFSWGLTPDYEIGSVSDIFFITNHRVNIQNLTPNTHYYFKINARDLYGHAMNYFGDFTTLPFPQLTMLPNVRDLTITGESNGIVLTWHNPDVAEFAGVIVVRSPYTYPRDSSDGKIIYEGEGNYVTDSSVQKNTTYYYTVFVYDSDRNYSSGSIGKSMSAAASPQPGLTLPPIFVLKLSDVDFIQNGRSLTYQYYPVAVVTDQNLTVSISAKKLPAALHFGTIQVDDPTESFSSTYLFSYNKTRDAYEAEVNLFGVSGGMYPFTIELQFPTGGKSVLTSTFDVTKTEISTNNSGLSGWQIVYEIFWIIIVFIILLILLFLIGLVLYLIIRRFSSHKK